MCCSPLHIAACQRDEKHLKFFLKIISLCGQIHLLNLTDVQQKTPLLIAVELDCLPCAKALVECKADCGVQTTNGNTCLHIAAEENYDNILSVIARYCKLEVIDMENNGKKIVVFIVIFFSNCIYIKIYFTMHHMFTNGTLCSRDT